MTQLEATFLKLEEKSSYSVVGYDGQHFTPAQTLKNLFVYHVIKLFSQSHHWPNFINTSL